MQRSFRSRAGRRRLATGLAATLLLPLTAVPAVAQAEWSPDIEVSQTTALTSGQTITVTGTGFDPEANTGTRPPFAGEPNGVYVVFGRFADEWRPSEGAPSSARQSIAQKWAVPAATAGPMMADASFVELDEDGSFTATLTVARDGGSGEYAVATYPAGGAVNADQELLEPVSFAPVEFADVSDDGAHTAAITELVERGVAAGTSSTTFGPAEPVTRGQLATFLARAVDLLPPAGVGAPAPDEAPFSDVPTTHPHAAGIAALADGDLVNGYDDGTFRPNATVRRDQIATMVAAWLELEPSDTAAFDDVSSASVHAGAINALAEARVVFGSNDRYQPGATLRRDQLASLLVRGLYLGEADAAVGNAGQLLTATPTDGLDPDGTTVTVTGRGYDDSKGVYVAFCVDNGPTAAPGPCVGGADQSGASGASAWVSSNPPAYAQGLTTPYGPGGSFEVEIVVSQSDGEVDCTDEGVTCMITTRVDHLGGADRSADARIPVTFAS